MTQAGFKAGGTPAPAIPEGGLESAIPGFRQLPGPVARQITGDWSDGEPRYMAAARATARYRNAEDRIPAFLKIALGVAIGLPAGHYLRPLLWIGVAAALGFVLAALYAIAFRLRLASIEVAREAETGYVDLEPLARKHGLTGVDAAALHANPGLRSVTMPDGKVVLSSLAPDKFRHVNVDLAPPAIQPQKSSTGGDRA